jgi:cytidylate kinase
MKTRIVTISHAWGAGGESLGRAIADRLGFRYVNEEVITVVADKHGLEASMVADVERRRGFLARIAGDLGGVATIAATSEGGGILVSDVSALTKRDDMRALILEAIEDIAERGNCVIVAHAASIPLAGRDDLLRVLVTASDKTRVQRLAEGTGGDSRAAERFMEESDAARADYFQRFYRIKRELPTHYDLVINTDTLEFDEAADIIVAAARRRV